MVELLVNIEMPELDDNERLLYYGNGCHRWNNCFNCPFEDCKSYDRSISLKATIIRYKPSGEIENV